ncbi:MAG: homocysteine biosynthesis protein, partial [Endomicrobia bacterium]|nr:homocysteine biosynthesis protein [Endomicrobiia bacterium]
WCAVSDEEIFAPVVDYSKDYPEVTGKSPLKFVSYKELRSGEITVEGRKVPTGALSSYAKARKIANILKQWIKDAKFFLTEPVQKLPTVGNGVKYKFLVS